MPLREKAKNFFKRRSSRSDSLSKTSSKESSRDRWPSNVYKPGEPMPRPKYRRPPEKAHKEKLDAFAWGDAWRRMSVTSDYSPMGTRLPSRRNSFLSFRKGIASRNASRNVSRNASVASGPGGKSGAKHRENIDPGRISRLSSEIPRDNTVRVAGSSQVQSVERDFPSPPRTAEALNSHSLSPNAHDHHQFSEAELALAMKRQRLAVPAQ